MPKYTVPEQEILQAALAGLQQSLASVDDKIAELRHRLGVRGANHSGAVRRGASPGKHVLSDAARRRIAAAQKKRWAAYRKAHQK